MKKFLIGLLILILLVTGVLLYSRYIGATGLLVKEYKITNTVLTDNFHGFKIVHISDIHYGRVTKDKELQQLVDKINLLKPDIVVLTGDLIDKDTHLTPEMADSIENILKKINVTVEKYAISGNHDVRFDNWETIIENAGFKNLDNTYDLIYKEGYSPLFIGGVSTMDNTTLSMSDKMKTMMEFLNQKPEDNTNNLPGEEPNPENNTIVKPIYKILLLHEPDLIDNVDTDSFDLVLAGHSHNGQVKIPFIKPLILPEGCKKYYDEYYKVNNTDLYVSSGIGTSNLNFRLFNKPSVNLYRLTNK